MKIKQYIIDRLLIALEPDLRGYDLTREEINGVFVELSVNDKVIPLLKAFLLSDKDRYFKAKTEDERNIIRGGYVRTMFFYMKIKDVAETAKKKSKKDKKTASAIKKGFKVGGRYG